MHVIGQKIDVVLMSPESKKMIFGMPDCLDSVVSPVLYNS